MSRVCIVAGCVRGAGWVTENLSDYCDEHAREWLLAEAQDSDREDFAQECADEDRRERTREYWR